MFTDVCIEINHRSFTPSEALAFLIAFLLLSPSVAKFKEVIVGQIHPAILGHQRGSVLPGCLTSPPPVQEPRYGGRMSRPPELHMR